MRGFTWFLLMGIVQGWLIQPHKRHNSRIASTRDDKEKDIDILAAPIKMVKQSSKIFGKVMSSNPVSRIFINTYNFWYWLPKRNMPYDMPWQLLKNSTVEWIAWYQFPHNLPPYRYLPIDRDGPF